MRRILKVFKVLLLTTATSLSLTACDKSHQSSENSIDISGINVNSIDIGVTLNQDVYINALQPFITKIQDKISSLLPTGEKIAYAVDYGITIDNHPDIYDHIKTFETLNINIFAKDSSHILKGSFQAQVNLIAQRKDISNIKIKDVTMEIEVNKTTFRQALALSCLPLIKTQIKIIASKAEKDSDYVVNIEGHEVVKKEIITSTAAVNVNVNAIEDDNHTLLRGHFTFILAFTEKPKN